MLHVAEVVLIPFGQEYLALDREAFDAALQRARELLPSTPSPSQDTTEVLTAEEMERRTNVPASWFLEAARQEKIPCIRFGKYPRFVFSDVLAAFTSGKREDIKAVETVRLRRRPAA